MPSITIASRFCGPKTSGNGGYSAGMIAKALLDEAPHRAVKVTLRSPPPLDRPIAIEKTDRGVQALVDELLVGAAKPAEVSIDRPDLPSAEDVEAARSRYEARGDEHLLPHCFVCGVGRAEGDGLRIFAGPVAENDDDSPIHADYWTPGADLAGDDGLVEPEFLWAALDCPGYFALPLDGELCLLGQLSAVIHRRPEPGERLLCAAWPTGHDGRKYFADSAIIDESGDTLAAANAVWILLNDPALLEKMRRENV